MKKIIFCGIFFVFGVMAFGQTHVPNGNFEKWDTNTLYSNPDNFASSNAMIFSFASVGNVLKSTDNYHGQYAARMETSNNYPGYIIAGTVGLNGPGGFAGGIPYSTVPDSFTGYFKYSCTNGDSGVIIVIFKLTGFPISINFYSVYGTSNTYSRFSYPLTKPGLPVSPDSVLIAFFSTSPGSSNTHNGNWLLVDYISFKNKTGTPAAIPNNDFENWTPVTSIEANGWTSMNTYSLMLGLPPSLTLSASSHSGKYAAHVTTINYVFGSTPQPMGFLTTGNLGNNGPMGGFPITIIPDSIGFYYKYSNPGNSLDSAGFGILFNKWDTGAKISSMVDSYIVWLPASSSYKFKTIPFKYISGKTPDTANIMIMSSNMDDSIHIGIGDNITIDDVGFFFGGLGIPADIVINDLIIYPNPASKQLNLRLNVPEQIKTLTINIYSVDGKQIKEEFYKELKTGENNLHINLDDLSSGNYLLSLSDNQKILFNKKFVVSR